MLELQFQVDRIPDQGLPVQGVIDAQALTELLEIPSPALFTVPDGAEVDLRLFAIGDAVRIVGELNVPIHAPCARCLEPCTETLHEVLDLTLFPASAQHGEARDMGDPEQAGDDAGEELSSTTLNSGFYHGDKLDLRETLREILLLDQPMRLLCKDDCAGLCDLCGHNLNLGPCQCVRDNVDPRWQALKDIKLA